MASEVRENRVVRNDKVFRDVPVGCDYAIHAHGLEGSLGAGTSRDPANEHDVAVRRVLDRLGAEVGNEVQQIDDALGILLRPPDRTRGLRPVTGDVWHGNRWHPGQHARLVRVEPRLPPVLDPVRTSLLRQLVIRPSRRHQKRTGTSCHSDKNGSTRDDLVSSGHSSLLCLDTLHNAALSRLVLKPTDASAHVTKMFDRVPPVDYAEGNAL